MSRLTIQMIVSIATAYRAKDYGITINDLQFGFFSTRIVATFRRQQIAHSRRVIVSRLNVIAWHF